MKRLFLSVLGALLLAPLPAFADLSDFKQDVEKAEDQNSKDDESDDADSDYDSDSGSDDFFAQLLFQIAGYLWAADNLYTTYGDYPYASKDFVQWPDWRSTRRGPVAKAKPGSNSWYTAEAQAFSVGDLGAGIWFAFQGHIYRFVGPYAEAWSITDGKESLNAARLGIEFALVQADPFNLSLYTQYQVWQGTLFRQGGTVGLMYRALLGKPLTMQVRLGVQGFTAFDIGEVELQFGWMDGPREFVGGWRAWGLDEGNTGRGHTYQGPFLGMKYWL